MTDEKRLDLYTSIVPNERQLEIQKTPFYAFVHYSINTFANREWGRGNESPKLFNPKGQDTDQWCRAIKSAGMKGLVLTCKHHDGFGLQENHKEWRNSGYMQTASGFSAVL